MFGKEMKNARFVVVHSEGSSFSESGRKQVLVDTMTGVTYLWVAAGYGGGITPLLDADGKPVIMDVSSYK